MRVMPKRVTGLVSRGASIAVMLASSPAEVNPPRIRDGLATDGATAPFRHSHLTWELPFYGVWAPMEPSGVEPR
jgi:hypothetical protein